MDFTTMRGKMEAGEYTTYEALQRDLRWGALGLLGVLGRVVGRQGSYKAPQRDLRWGELGVLGRVVGRQGTYEAPPRDPRWGALGLLGRCLWAARRGAGHGGLGGCGNVPAGGVGHACRGQGQSSTTVMCSSAAGRCPAWAGGLHWNVALQQCCLPSLYPPCQPITALLST